MGSANRAFLFDLDGTLQDSEVLWVAATRAYLADHDVALSDDEALALVYGHSWRDVYAGIVRLAPRLDRGVDVLADELRPYFLRLRDAGGIAIPGSVALLRRLAASGTPVAVVSGATRQDVADGVRELAIGDCLRFYLGAEDYPRGKPDPACYLLAARRLALPPAACTVFEDSTAGVRAAKAAGMRCVALRRPLAPPQNFAGADLVLADLADFDPRSP